MKSMKAVRSFISRTKQTDHQDLIRGSKSDHSPTDYEPFDEDGPYHTSTSTSTGKRRGVFVSAPDYCNRCLLNPATIACRHIAQNRIEFICDNCRMNDPYLRDQPIKKNSTNRN